LHKILIIKNNLMKKFVVCLMVVSAVAYSVNAQTKKTTVKTTVATKTATPVLKNLLDSFSYAAGINIAANMKAQGISNINSAMMVRAIEDEFKNNPKLMTQEQCSQKLQEQMQSFSQKKSGEAIVKGKAFLASNKTRAGVVSLPSGVQYEILKAGEAGGLMPMAIDTVVVHYRGTLIDGTEFDGSMGKGDPITYPANGFIKGWTEVLQMMTKGAHWKVYIPSDLAYGDRGSGAVPPGATLIFEINLLDIKPAAKQ
jgi:FKBP-type peptidyl-prolyl cis-trans isomerase FklB